MSKDWYPVINYIECTECGTCIDMCRHGVYDKSKAPSPLVIFPEGCIKGCKGCGNLCPSNAIKYLGDIENNCNCNCKSCCE
ncbi:MAG: 4Fe-4S dicluster domain-containing protein [Actinomycetota bacterium]|nr:4Fe-4S dicluster domain-containing protein [Actinomycetota bacterium]